MKKDMPLEGLRWSRDSGSALYDTPPNGRSRTGWGVAMKRILGDAKSQMDQNLCGLFWSFTQFFTSGQNYPMSHPRMNCS